MEKVIGAVFVALVVGVLIALFGAIFTQYAWDHSVAEIFKLPEISFWQAFCLNMLGGVCRSSSSSSSSKG